MKSYDLGEQGYLLVLERGEEILKTITTFAEDAGLTGASIQGIGAADFVRLGQYDYTRKDYQVVEFEGALEVVSLIGNISLRDGAPLTHAHMTITTQDGKAFGGHLLDGSRCALTLEVEIKDLGRPLERRVDPRFNLGVLY